MVIYNKLIPIKGYKAVNLFGIIFARKGCTMTDKDINHEAIHTAQIRELLYVGFYIAYVAEWLVRLLLSGNAYRNISFEREAYMHENNLNYLTSRKKWAFINYLTNKR